MTPNMMCTGTTARYAACQPLQDMQAHCCALQLNGQVDRYMQAARDVCAEERVPLCDCYALWKERFAGGEDITALLSNEINHPSRQLHRLFAEQLLRVLLQEGLLDQTLQETDQAARRVPKGFRRPDGKRLFARHISDACGIS